MFTNPNPDCEKECLFSQSESVKTLMAYHPMYDKHGNNINPDRNITRYVVHCHTCGKAWRAEETMGNTTFTIAE